MRRRSGVFTRLLERLVPPVVVGPLFTRSLLGTSMVPTSPLGAPGPLPTCPRPPRQAASPPWTGSFVPPWLHSPTNTGRGSTGSSLAAQLLTLDGLQCSSSWQGPFLAIAITANCAQLSSPMVKLVISSYRTTKLGSSGTRRSLDLDKSSSATWCSPKPRPQSACSGKAALWCAEPLASVFRSVSRGWTDCLHSSTAVNFKAPISRSHFCARAHAGFSEYLNPASRLSFSIFISSKLVAAKPSGRLF